MASIHLHQQRCFLHSSREAVARCPSCERFYCRECITEHDHRIMCTSCLEVLLQPKTKKSSASSLLPGLAQLLLGGLLLWILFVTLGEILISLPSSFHEGTVWQDTLTDP